MIYINKQYHIKLSFKAYRGGEVATMKQYIVWVRDNGATWESYYFDTLDSANNFIVNNELDDDSLEIIESK